MALIPIIRSAGGIITNFQGSKEIGRGSNINIIASGSKEIHNQVIKALKGL